MEKEVNHLINLPKCKSKIGIHKWMLLHPAPENIENDLYCEACEHCNIIKIRKFDGSIIRVINENG